MAHKTFVKLWYNRGVIHGLKRFEIGLKQYGMLIDYGGMAGFVAEVLDLHSAAMYISRTKGFCMLSMDNSWAPTKSFGPRQPQQMELGFLGTMFWRC